MEPNNLKILQESNQEDYMNLEFLQGDIKCSLNFSNENIENIQNSKYDVNHNHKKNKNRIKNYYQMQKHWNHKSNIHNISDNTSIYNQGYKDFKYKINNDNNFECKRYNSKKGYKHLSNNIDQPIKNPFLTCEFENQNFDNIRKSNYIEQRNLFSKRQDKPTSKVESIFNYSQINYTNYEKNKFSKTKYFSYSCCENKNDSKEISDTEDKVEKIDRKNLGEDNTKNCKTRSKSDLFYDTENNDNEVYKVQKDNLFKIKDKRNINEEFPTRNFREKFNYKRFKFNQNPDVRGNYCINSISTKESHINFYSYTDKDNNFMPIDNNKEFQSGNKFYKNNKNNTYLNKNIDNYKNQMINNWTKHFNRQKNFKNNAKTHFINIPILDEYFLEEYKKFCEFISSQNIKNFQPEMLQKPGKLHFTVCVLDLGEDPHKIQKVHTILENLNSEIKYISNGDLTYNFDGFNTMGKVEDCRVVYSKIKEDINYEKLCKIINLIISKFVQEGIMNKQELSQSHITYNKKQNFYSIKVHMTLLNILFMNKILKKKQIKTLKSIDSYEILQFMNETVVFPSAQLKEIHFSRMRENKITEKYEMLYSYNI